MPKSNKTKDCLLGQSHGAASNRLRKMILYSMLYGKVYDRNCFQCEGLIESIDDLSIEHKEPWQGAADPKAAFFDLENIAFSHLRCNSGATTGGGKFQREKTHCPKGHEYTEANTYHPPTGQQVCRKCAQEHRRQFRRRHPEQDSREYRRRWGL